jgi:peroxiredoxin Q/BCP
MASVDDPAKNADFAKQHGGDFPILSDPEKKAAMAYGVINTAAPPNRQVAQRWNFFIGPDGRILDIEKKVSVKTAGADLVKKLEALGVKKKKS